MPPPKKDTVHRYFDYIEDNNCSKCNLCAKKIKGKHTSNLKSHLATKHLVEYQIVSHLNKIKTTNQLTSVQSSLVEKINKICVRLVTEHGRSIYMVQDTAFQELISLACSKDAAITKQINLKSIKKTVYEQANLIRSKIWSEIKNKLLSIKLDAVTCAQRTFLGFNVQYIKNGRIVVRNLAIREVHEPLTASFLKSALEEVLADFQISTGNIYCICTDNGTYMIKTEKHVGVRYNVKNETGSNHDEEESNEEGSDEEEEQGNGLEKMEEAQNDNDHTDEEERPSADFIFTDADFNAQDLVSVPNFNMRGMLCAAHSLQLAIEDAIAENMAAQSIFSLARIIVSILRQPNNAHALESVKNLKAIIDCSTKWTSSYNMLKRLLKLQHFVSDIQEVSSLISPIFWTELTSIIECLKPAREATIILQKQDLTIGDFYITWANCKTSVSAVEHNFAISLVQAMEARERKLLQNDVILEALYMDRRLNVILNDQQCAKARSLLNETYQQLQKLNQTAENVDTEESSQVKQSDESIAVPSTSQATFSLETFLTIAEGARRESRQLSSFDFCLNELIIGPRLPVKENIINHWNNPAVVTSDLTMVANTVLAVPSTQASVERLYHSINFILNPLRINLSQYLLRDIMLIRQNKDLID